MGIMRLRELFRLAVSEPDSLVGREIHPLAFQGWLRSKHLVDHRYWMHPSKPSTCVHQLVFEYEGKRIYVLLEHANPYTFHSVDDTLYIMDVQVK